MAHSRSASASHSRERVRWGSARSAEGGAEFSKRPGPARRSHSFGWGHHICPNSPVGASGVQLSQISTSTLQLCPTRAEEDGKSCGQSNSIGERL